MSTKIKVGVILPYTDPDPCRNNLYPGPHRKKLLNLMQKQINDFVEANFTQSLEIIYEFSDFVSSDVSHLNKVKQFWTEGVDIIIGGGFSSYAKMTLDWINGLDPADPVTHDLLLLSPTSTALPKDLRVMDDMLFRLMPYDDYEARIIASALREKGITKIGVIRQKDDWAILLEDELITKFINSGGVNAQTVATYSLNQDDRVEDMDVIAALAAAQSWASRSDDEAIVFLGFDEIRQFLRRLCPVLNIQINETYPNGYSIEKTPERFSKVLDTVWFTNQMITCQIDVDTPKSILNNPLNLVASRLKLYNPQPISPLPLIRAHRRPPIEPIPQTWYSIGLNAIWRNAKYTDLLWCDATWIIANCLLRIQNDPDLLIQGKRALKVKQVLPDIADEYTDGYTGWCTLDQYGDRRFREYWMYGFNVKNGQMGFEAEGKWKVIDEKVVWY